MAWTGYNPCCAKWAADLSSLFCGDCRTPLLRCMNFSECKQLVPPHGPCEMCLSPEIVIEEGTTISGGIGARLALPLKLRNFYKQIRQPIYLKTLVKNESGRPPETVDLNWEIVEPGTERTFHIEAGPFDTDGVTHVELLLTVATRAKEGFEEAYVFTGSLLLNVSRDTNQQVVQNINLSGAHFETGGLIKADVDARQEAERTRTTGDRQVVKLERVERPELRSGVRGYADTGQRVARSVAFCFHGFPQSDAPTWDTRIGATGAIAFGRIGREPDPSAGVTPMDVSLRAYERDGTLDGPTSGRISRHHFDLRVLNDRLVLHAHSGKGALVNGEEVRKGALRAIGDGDLIAPSRDVADKVAMRVLFHGGPHGRVERIELRREPSVGG